jgi:hypothetical protein
MISAQVVAGTYMKYASAGRECESAGSGPLRLNRPISSSPTQNAFLQSRIALLEEQGAFDIRVNQQQVDINGVRVGINRPDLQYTLNGQRYHEQFETSSIDAAWAHMRRIMGNDPTGRFIPWLVP